MTYLLRQSENLPLVNSSKLGIHLQILLIQSLDTIYFIVIGSE